MIRYKQTDIHDGASNVLTVVRMGDTGQLAVQITTGPDLGDDFVQLTDLDGDELLYSNVEWETAADVPAEALEQIEAAFSSGTKTLERLDVSVTVYQDSDYSSLGVDATQADLDGYCENLAAHLAEKFKRPVQVEQRLGGKVAGRYCSESEEIDAYVEVLCQGDGWVDLLPEAEDS